MFLRPFKYLMTICLLSITGRGMLKSLTILLVCFSFNLCQFLRCIFWSAVVRCILLGLLKLLRRFLYVMSLSSLSSTLVLKSVFSDDNIAPLVYFSRGSLLYCLTSENSYFIYFAQFSNFLKRVGKRMEAEAPNCLCNRCTTCHQRWYF